MNWAKETYSLGIRDLLLDDFFVRHFDHALDDLGHFHWPIPENRFFDYPLRSWYLREREGEGERGREGEREREGERRRGRGGRGKRKKGGTLAHERQSSSV